MAIVALLLAVLLAFAALRMRPSPSRKLLLALGAGAAIFALYLAVAEPAMAWDLHWVGRAVVKMIGPILRQAL